MCLVLVEGPDALLQGQQGFIDLSPIHPGLLVLVLHVGASLTAGQVDEGEFTVQLFAVLDAQLH